MAVDQLTIDTFVGRLGVYADLLALSLKIDPNEVIIDVRYRAPMPSTPISITIVNPDPKETQWLSGTKSYSPRSPVRTEPST